MQVGRQGLREEGRLVRGDASVGGQKLNFQIAAATWKSCSQGKDAWMILLVYVSKGHVNVVDKTEWVRLEVPQKAQSSSQVLAVGFMLWSHRRSHVGGQSVLLSCAGSPMRGARRRLYDCQPRAVPYLGVAWVPHTMQIDH